MRVAVLGGGLQGACVAMELAAAGIEVDLYDKNDHCMSQASAQNEGKIHLGYVYANDRSLRTARMMVQGAVAFAPLLRRWLGESVDSLPVSTPFHYVVHRDSLLGIDSEVYQLFGKLGWQRASDDVALTIAHADNSLTGNGLQEEGFLTRDYGSVYTKPDITNNRATFVNLTARHAFNSRAAFSGNAYYRHISTNALNGDINEDSLDQALYQPTAAEQAALAAAGYSGFPTSGAPSRSSQATGCRSSRRTC